MRNSQDVSFTTVDPLLWVDYEAIQIPITAGHEFIVTTDVKYKGTCDDKYMYVDYVSRLHYTTML